MVMNSISGLDVTLNYFKGQQAAIDITQVRYTGKAV